MMVPRLIPSDASIDAACVQFAVLRKMGSAGRARQTFELNDKMRSTVIAGVRDRHPEYTPEDVRLAVFRLTLGDDLFHEAFPGVVVTP